MAEQEYYVERRSDRFEFFYQSTRSGKVAARAHIHDSIELLYIKEGSYTVYLDDAVYTLQAGDLVLFCSNSIHRVVSGEREKNGYYVIKVNPSVLLDFSMGTSFLLRFGVSRPENRCVWTREMLLSGEIRASLDAIVTEGTGGGYATEVAMRLGILRLLLAILRDGHPEEVPEEDGGEALAGLIYEAIVYIRQHFSEDVNAAELAARLGLSYSYFSRSFGRIAGKSFKEYLNLTRVNCAERLLLTTGKSVTEIAAACGYNNVSYFISVYRKMKGVTPRATSRAVANRAD